MSKIEDFFYHSKTSLVRMTLALYLAYFFISLILQKSLVENLVANTNNHLHWFIVLGPIVGTVLCLLFLLGVIVNYSAFGLFLCYQMGFILLPIPKEVQASYISIILLVFVLFHKKEDQKKILNSQLNNSSQWYLCLFLAVYFGFTISGLSKVFYEPWLNGKAVDYFCTTSNIGNFMGSFLCALLPKTFLGYLVLFIEISSFPLALFKKTRPLTWILNTILHISIPIFLYVWPVSFGVLLMQILLLDPQWIKQRTQFLRTTKH